MSQHDRSDERDPLGAPLDLRDGAAAPGPLGPDEPAVRREIVLPVSRDAAWAMLGDPAGLAEWLADEVELELREGAEGRFRWDTGEERRATVEELADRRRLVLRWHEVGGPASIVELTLDEVEGGTRLVVVEVPERVLRAVGTELVGAVLGAPGGEIGGSSPRMVALSCA